MKNRSIPYGYQYQNGTVTLHPKETEILRRVFRTYLDGLSLLKIAEQLNREQVEYMPDVAAWNKARLMRIIDDARYLGTDAYPAIIDENTHEALKKLKKSKNTQRNIDRSADIFNLSVPVYCPACGGEMHRRHDSRCKCHQRWTCQNPDCRELIILSDEEMLKKITEQLNTVIANPDRIHTDTLRELEPGIETRRLENEIARTLDGVGFDKETLRKKMMECVALKYSDIGDDSHTAKRMKADFEKSGLLSAFSAELFARTVKSITIETDKTVHLTLINGQQIGKEKIHDTNSNNSLTA